MDHGEGYSLQAHINKRWNAKYPCRARSLACVLPFMNERTAEFINFGITFKIINSKLAPPVILFRAISKDSRIYII